MKTLFAVFALAVTLVGCESMYADRGIPRIRSQRQADAYNATVSAEQDKLVCERERLTGSALPQFVCITVAQRERLAIQAREDIDFVGRTQNSGAGFGDDPG